jgi:hypothetical protein
MKFQNRDNIRIWLAQDMHQDISGPAEFQAAKVAIRVLTLVSLKERHGVVRMERMNVI